MRILIIDNSIGVTGAIKAIVETIDLLKNKHQFIFVIPKGSKTKELLVQHNFTYYELDFIEISRNLFKNLIYPFRLIGNAYRLSKIVNENKIDVIQVNDIYNLSGLFTKFFVKVKVITHVRRMPESFPIKLYQVWVKIASKYSDFILPVSHANSKIFKKNSKIQVLYDPTILDEKTFVYETNNSGVINILYLANYTRGKGQNYAIEVLKNLQNEGNGHLLVNLKFVGSDFEHKVNIEFKNELKELVKAYKLSNCVQFLGESKNIFEEISNCDIMLNFSDSESLSRVTMEALYYGVPIIATNVGGTSEMIEDGFNGILVEKGNITQMTKELNKLIVSKEKRLLFSKNNENFIKNKFSLGKISKQLNSIYYSI